MPTPREPSAEPTNQHTAWPTPPPVDEAHRTPDSGTLLPDAQPLAGPGEEPGTQPTTLHGGAPALPTLLLSLALAVVGFVAIAALIHLALPHPLLLRADFRSGKLQLASQFQGRTFSAAFGSSHVHNGFDPRSFDSTLSGTPFATGTLNLAVIGGSQTEQRVMALSYLHHLQPPPAQQHDACFVMLELNAGANFTNDHLIHPRAINIYDTGTDRFMRGLVSPQMPLEQRAGRLGFAAAASLLHYINLGMLSNRLFPAATPDPGLDMETAGDRRGLWSLDPTPGFRAHVEDILSHTPRTHHTTPGTFLPGNTSLIQELAAATPLHNVHFVYIVEPKVSDLTEQTVWPDDLAVNGQLVPILNLAQPDRYPQLYSLDNWFDNAHLSSKGAALASTLLAEALQSFYTAHPAPMRCGA